MQNGLPAGNFDYYQLATGLSGINKVPPPYGSDMPEPFDKRDASDCWNETFHPPACDTSMPVHS